MVFGTAQNDRFSAAWTALATMVAEDGSRRQTLPATLIAPGAAMRDLADGIHCLCLLHGRQPGVIDSAAARPPSPAAEPWLAEAATAFADERAHLIRLVAAVGPLPSTPGQAETEAAIVAQRHALDMMATSDRAGCPIGAALALVLDWTVIRQVLDSAANRIGIELPAPTLPTPAAGAELIARTAGTPAFERAVLFGTQQLLAQHRALWQLLEARAAARNAA